MTPAFLSRCGRATSSDPEDLRRWGELWSDPDVYARAFWPVQELIDRATAAVAELFATGRLAYRIRCDWSRRLEPTFLGHDFFVPAASTWIDGRWSVAPRCCAGLGDGWNGEIFVSTRDPEVVPGLITWETINARLDQAGRREWADRHSRLDWKTGELLEWLITPDAGAVRTSRRRSVGR
ncbi:MAG: hypothetical protein WA208_01475 [Thermoanaerobaculia bacterium]